MKWDEVYEELVESARRHVVQAEARVGRQKSIVTALARRGHDTAQAEKLLATLENALDAMREHLAVEMEHLQAYKALGTTMPGSGQEALHGRLRDTAAEGPAPCGRGERRKALTAGFDAKGFDHGPGAGCAEIPGERVSLMDQGLARQRARAARAPPGRP